MALCILSFSLSLCVCVVSVSGVFKSAILKGFPIHRKVRSSLYAYKHQKPNCTKKNRYLRWPTVRIFFPFALSTPLLTAYLLHIRWKLPVFYCLACELTLSRNRCYWYWTSRKIDDLRRVLYSGMRTAIYNLLSPPPNTTPPSPSLILFVAVCPK